MYISYLFKHYKYICIHHADRRIVQRECVRWYEYFFGLRLPLIDMYTIL